MEKYQEIERSIIKKFRKSIWSRFVKAVKEYELIKENDKIMVCISGGKDSFLLAKCIEELEKHSDIPFKAEYVCMNPGYNKENEAKIIENAKILNINLKMFNSNIFDVAFSQDTGSPCYLCARMRRGCLYKEAKKLGCNKIALGHHFNDVIETILMGMFYGAQVQTMMPKVCSTSHPGMQLIRPLYFVREEDIIRWANRNDLDFIKCACKVTAKSANDCENSKREEMKNLIKKLKENYENIDVNIFNSVKNVNLDTIISYRKKDDYHHFLDDYNKSKE